LTLFLWITLFALVGWSLARWRLRRLSRPTPGGSVSDETVRLIEEEGTVSLSDEEPLDMDEVRAEEDDFWSETWDEPEEM